MSPQPRRATVGERIDWLQKHRKRACPDHGGPAIEPELYKATFWCTTCQQPWRVSRGGFDGTSSRLLWWRVNI